MQTPPSCSRRAGMSGWLGKLLSIDDHRSSHMPEYSDHISIVNVLWVLDSIRAWAVADAGAPHCPPAA